MSRIKQCHLIDMKINESTRDEVNSSGIQSRRRRVRRPYVVSTIRLVIPRIAAIPRQLYGGVPFLISTRLKGWLQGTKGIEIHGVRMWGHANSNRCVESPGSIRAWSIDPPTRWFDSTAVIVGESTANFHFPEKPTSRNQTCRAARKKLKMSVTVRIKFLNTYKNIAEEVLREIIFSQTF